MKEAIQKAIEGGWQVYAGDISKLSKDDMDALVSLVIKNGGEKPPQRYPHFLLDPLFWQALGKAMGWADQDRSRRPFWRRQEEGNISHIKADWELEWLNFTHHLAEGKSPDSFFKELLESSPRE